MSEENGAEAGQDSYFVTPVIPFAPDTGFLGMMTNGAMPQAVEGFLVEAEYLASDGGTFHYWLKARTDGSDEPVVFGTDMAQFEHLCAAILQTAKLGAPPTRLKGRLDGYHNTAQVAFNEETPEECVNDLACEVSRTNDVQGVQVVLGHVEPSGRLGKAVARLSGGYPDGSLHALTREFQRMKAWHTEHRDAYAAAADAGGPTP